MKLKKIVSLALAGVLAVSMLAGCSNNGNVVNPGTEDVTSQSIILNTLKTAQNGNDVVIDFKQGNDLTEVINKQLEDQKLAVAESDVKTAVEKALIPGGTLANKGLKAADLNAESVTADTYYSLVLKRYNKVTEEKACFDFANEIEDVSTLKASFNGKGSSNGDTEMNATYTGTASVVSFTDYEGNTYYYIAVLVKTVVEAAK